MALTLVTYPTTLMIQTQFLTPMDGMVVRTLPTALTTPTAMVVLTPLNHPTIPMLPDIKANLVCP